MFRNPILGKAANAVVPNKDVFTEDMFFDFMPQFQKEEIKTNDDGSEYKVRTSLVPEKALKSFIKQANSNVLQCRWFEKWEYACALYTAHYCTLYLKQYNEQSSSINNITSNNSSGVVSSVTLGDVSTSYDNSIITSSLTKWGIWASTPYGQQLVQEAKLLGIGPAYFI